LTTATITTIAHTIYDIDDDSNVNDESIAIAKANAILDELQVLTEGNTNSGGSRPTSTDCPPPLKFYRNRIVRPTSMTTSMNAKNTTIPRILHVSMKSKCLPQDIDMYMKRWEEQLPNHSIIFHDDDAVHDLIYNNNNHHDYGWSWSDEFPWLNSAMKCVLSKGAMTIDVWRVLVLVSTVVCIFCILYLFFFAYSIIRFSSSIRFSFFRDSMYSIFYFPAIHPSFLPTY